MSGRLLHGARPRPNPGVARAPHAGLDAHFRLRPAAEDVQHAPAPLLQEKRAGKTGRQAAANIFWDHFISFLPRDRAAVCVVSVVS